MTRENVHSNDRTGKPPERVTRGGSIFEPGGLADRLREVRHNTIDDGRPPKRADGRRVYQLVDGTPSLRCPACKQPNTAMAQSPYEEEEVECSVCGERAQLSEWE